MITGTMRSGSKAIFKAMCQSNLWGLSCTRVGKASLHCNGISILSWLSDFECTKYSLGSATLVIFLDNEEDGLDEN